MPYIPTTPTPIATLMPTMIHTGSFVLKSQKAGNAHAHAKSAASRYMIRRPNRSDSQPIRGIVTTARPAATVIPSVPTDLISAEAVP